MKFIFWLLLIFSSLITFSQQTDTLDAVPQYYYSFKDKLSVHLYGITKFNSIELRSPSSDTLIKYQPNENFNIGAGFNYKWAGISAAFNFRFINNDNQLYGNTTSFDLQSDIYSRKFIWTINLQSYNGFYWGNVNKYDSTWSIRDSVPLRPDISTINLGVNMIYTFNHQKFSFKAPFVFTERQKHSAGSWLYGAFMSLYSLNTDSVIVPSILQNSFSLYDSLTSLTTINIGNSIGYSYTFVFFDKFYFNGTLMVGLSMQIVGAYDLFGRVIMEEARLSTKSHLRLSLGSNNDKCYYGISIILDSYPVKNQFESSFVYNYGKFRIYYGRHLNWESRKRQYSGGK